MPDTGAPWNLPYPSPTDLVRDAPQAFEDLAVATAAGLDDAGSEGIGPNVVMAQKTDTQTSSVSNNASVTVAGLTATITPSSATSKVLVMFEINHESSTTSAFSPVLKRGATAIGLGAAAGSRTLVTSGAGEGSSGIAALGQAVGIVLDSPNTTDPVSYTVDMRNRNNGSQTLYVNLSDDDTDSARFVRSASRIIAIEVKA